MSQMVDRAGLKVAAELAKFVEARALPGTGTGIEAEGFWSGFAGLLADLTPQNERLLQTRARMQGEIDAWHREHATEEHDAEAYRAFLTEIGYLVPAPDPFEIETEGVDPEIALIAGPQLVVPVMNARFALNAANARWGSLYDALYGTDATGETAPEGGYDAAHGARAIAWGRAHLDAAVPLAQGSWADIDALGVEGGRPTVALEDPAQFVGHRSLERGQGLVFARHGLHIEVVVDPESRIGAQDRAGIADIRLEAALSSIMDCEDSVAAVDAADKVLAYGNWLGLMKGDLTHER